MVKDTLINYATNATIATGVVATVTQNPEVKPMLVGIISAAIVQAVKELFTFLKRKNRKDTLN